MNIYLELPRDASPALRSRLTYAFRLFCAVYGHAPIVDAAQAGGRHVALRYRGPAAESAIADVRTVWLCRGYRVRDLREAAPAPVRYLRNGLGTILHGEPERSKTPDWLGEIFEWVSCSDEWSVTARDRFGAPLPESTYLGRHNLDPRIPYAALAMCALQQEICRVVPRASEQPRPPECAGAHVVLPMHDVAYFPLGSLHTVHRLAQDGVRSSLRRGKLGLAARQAGYAVRAAVGSGRDPLDCIALLAEEEQRRGFRASWFFQARRGHRLDADYSLEHAGVLETMRWLAARGMEIGLAGSFTGLEESGGLAEEAGELSAAGFVPAGARVHRRQQALEQLIPAVEKAGLAWDASVGWPGQPGFRAAACFPFPPYNFAEERPARFLEFPLVVAEEGLEQQHGEAQRFHEVAQMLAVSRRLGWGGVSILWRPTAFGSGWLAPQIGEIFWRLADDRARWKEVWMRGSRLLEMVRPRYVEAGLLSAATSAAQAGMLPVVAQTEEQRTAVQVGRGHKPASAKAVAFRDQSSQRR